MKLEFPYFTRIQPPKAVFEPVGGVYDLVILERGFWGEPDVLELLVIKQGSVFDDVVLVVPDEAAAVYERPLDCKGDSNQSQGNKNAATLGI